MSTQGQEPASPTASKMDPYFKCKQKHFIRSLLFRNFLARALSFVNVFAKLVQITVKSKELNDQQGMLAAPLASLNLRFGGCALARDYNVSRHIQDDPLGLDLRCSSFKTTRLWAHIQICLGMDAWYDYYKQILLIGEQKIIKLLCFWHPQCRQGGRGGYVHRNIGWKSMFRFLLEFQILVFSPIKSLTCSMDDKHFGNSVKYFREHKHLALFLNHSIWHMPNIRTVLPDILPQDK